MSHLFGTILQIPGYILTFGGALWLLIIAFRNSIPWGLAIFFFPPAAFVFAARHLLAFIPLAVSVAGLVLLIVGLQLAEQ